MPGFVGCLISGDGPLEGARSAACSALMHEAKEDTHSVTAGPLWLATVGPSGREPVIHHLPGGDVLLVWGELFGEGESRLPCESIATYALNPKVAAPGAHALAHWSPASMVLSLVTDHTAARPIYYAETKGGFVFGSRPGAVAALMPVTPQPNPAAWFDLLAFGAVTGDATFFDGVMHLPPASRLCVRASNFQASIGVIPLPQPQPPISVGEAVDRFILLSRQAIKRAVGSAKKVTVLSSGGMDSRLVWAALPTQDRETVGVSFGPPDLPDVIVAGQICSALGASHVHLEITPEDIRTLGPEVVRLTDATFPFLHGVGNLLTARQGPETEVVLDGAKGWIDTVSPKAWLWRRQTVILRQLVSGDLADLAELLTPEASQEFLRHTHSRLADASLQAGHGPLQDCLLALDRVTQRMYMQANLVKLGRVAAVSPLHDLALARYVSGLPRRLRLNKFLQSRAVCVLSPSLGALAYTETGFPLHSLWTPYSVYPQEFYRLLKGSPLCLRGRRLFDVYDRWSRDGLSDWFREVLSTWTDFTESLIKRQAPAKLVDRQVGQGGQVEMLARLATLFLWAAEQRQFARAAKRGGRRDHGKA